MSVRAKAYCYEIFQKLMCIYVVILLRRGRAGKVVSYLGLRVCQSFENLSKKKEEAACKIRSWAFLKMMMTCLFFLRPTMNQIETNRDYYLVFAKSCWRFPARPETATHKDMMSTMKLKT